MSSNCKTFARIIPVLASWIVVLTCSVLFFAFACPYLIAEYNISLIVLHAFLTLSVIVNFGLTTFTDPGIYPRAGKEEKEIIVKPLPYKTVDIKGVEVRLKWCNVCLIYRPPRTSHCNVCNCCIEKFDHHCPWVNNCIGRRNYRFFFQFLLFFTLQLFYTSVLCAIYIVDHKTSLLQSANSIAVLCLVGAMFILFIPVVGLTCYHVFLVFEGKTSDEQIKMKDMRNPFSGNSRYDNCSYTFCGPVWPKLIGRNGIKYNINVIQMKVDYDNDNDDDDNNDNDNLRNVIVYEQNKVKTTTNGESETVIRRFENHQLLQVHRNDSPRCKTTKLLNSDHPNELHSSSGSGDLSDQRMLQFPVNDFDISSSRVGSTSGSRSSSIERRSVENILPTVRLENAVIHPPDEELFRPYAHAQQQPSSYVPPANQDRTDYNRYHPEIDYFRNDLSNRDRGRYLSTSNEAQPKFDLVYESSKGGSPSYFDRQESRPIEEWPYSLTASDRASSGSSDGYSIGDGASSLGDTSRRTTSIPRTSAAGANQLKLGSSRPIFRSAGLPPPPLQQQRSNFPSLQPSRDDRKSSASALEEEDLPEVGNIPGSVRRPASFVKAVQMSDELLAKHDPMISKHYPMIRYQRRLKSKWTREMEVIEENDTRPLSSYEVSV